MVERGSRLKVLLPSIAISGIGLLWNYRHLNSQQEVGLDAYLEAGAPPLPPTRRRRRTRPDPDRRTVDFWERNESSCVHVDNVCGWNRRGWFYGPGGGHGRHAHQPTISLVLNRDEIEPTHGYGIKIDRRIHFNVSSTSHIHYDDEFCSFSPAPYHMVLQSAYNDMIGEFYSRSLLGMNRWMRDYFPSGSSNDDAQMYVHFVNRWRKMFVGHRLFLGGLPNNNRFDNFVSMMPGDSCRCYEKLIFCGYDAESAPASSIAHDADPEEVATVFKPRPAITNPDAQCYVSLDPKCVAYRKLQRDLISTYREKDPDINQKIRQYQRRILIEKGLIHNNTSDVDEWRLVGLAHRTYRRIWLNIDDAIALCDRKFRRHKIVCITIDVEEATSPEEQLLMHRSLHAFIGVHGAQLTQGVLLPKHGYILEFLPWVPFYLWGSWVATTHVPTPLGVIFQKTHLNHVGYPLGRESVPLCSDVDKSDEERTRLCLMNETSGVLEKFRWADRDFNVPLQTIEDFVSEFLLKENNPITCDDMQKRAERKNFVMYNAFCKQNATQRMFISKQYYRKKDDRRTKNVHERGGTPMPRGNALD